MEVNYDLLKFYIQHKCDINKIVSMYNLIDDNDYPNANIIMGDYFKELTDYDMMSFFYEKAVNNPKSTSRGLVKIMMYNIEINNLDLAYEIIKSNKITKKILLDFISSLGFRYPYIAYNICEIVNDAESYEVAYGIASIKKHYGLMLHYLLILAKKYDDKDRKKQLLSSISIIAYNKINEIYYDKKCYGCKHRKLPWNKLQCKHNLCVNCCYESLNDKWECVCPCSYKSMCVFNDIVQYYISIF